MQILIVVAVVGVLVLLAFIASRTRKVDRPSDHLEITPRREHQAHSTEPAPSVEVPGSRPEAPALPSQEHVRSTEARNREHRASQVQVAPRAHRKSPYALPPKFVVIDVETTGLSAHMHEIIEIGALKVADVAAGNHTAYRVLVKPASKIPRNIVALTGITQAMVDTDGVELRTAIEGFLEFIEDLPLIAFNAPFDRGFLEAAAAQCGRAIPNQYTCALQAARRAWPGLVSYKLSELSKLGGLDMTDEHRAVSDCVRTAHVFIAASRTLCPEDDAVHAK
jgi:DNA polymerase III subunit epsilon